MKSIGRILHSIGPLFILRSKKVKIRDIGVEAYVCLLYTSDAADDLLCVDLGGRRIIKKKTTNYIINIMKQHNYLTNKIHRTTL